MIEDIPNAAHANSANEPPVDGVPADLDFGEVLTAPGATPDKVSDSLRRELDELGNTTFPNLVGPAWLEQLRETFERIYHDEGDQAGIEVSQMPDERRLADLVNKSPAFDGVWLNPHVLAAAHHLMRRPLKLHSLNGHARCPDTAPRRCTPTRVNHAEPCASVTS